MEERLTAWLHADVYSDGSRPDVSPFLYSEHNQIVKADGTPSYVCPEETGRIRDCESCGYCFKGQKHDVTFLEHAGK